MKKLILVGKGASGKDYAYKRLGRIMKKGIKYTTRPSRDGEKDGIDYKFITNEEFNNIEMLFKQSFIINGDLWQYGVSVEEFDSMDLFIMTPNEIEQIKDRLNECIVVYIDISREIREQRLNNRNDNNDNNERRLNSDEEDFKDFTLFNYKIQYEKFTIDEIIELYIND